MADDSQIKIGLSIDTSGLGAAQSAAQTSADQIAAAYDKVAAASLAVQNVQSRHRDILTQYKASVFDASTTTKLLSENLAENAVATTTLANAKRTLAAISGQEAPLAAANAEAIDKETQAQVRAISARQAGAASIGILEGRMMSGNRAAAAFLSTTLGLGPILEAAFPVIGLIALGEVAVQVGKSLYNAFDMGGERARKAAEDFREVTESLRTMNDEINVEIDRLTVADEKLEHKPTNGMKLAIDEAILDADRLDQKLDGILKKLETAVKDSSGSFLQQVVGEKGGTGYEQTMVSEHERHLSEQTSTQGQLNESVSYYNSLLVRQNELKGWIANTDTSPATVGAYRTELDAVQRLITAQGQEQQYIKATMDLQDAQAEHQKISDNADSQRLAKEAARAQSKMLGEFVSESITDYKDVEAESKRVTEEITAAWIEGQKADEEATRKDAQADRDATEDYKRNHEQQMKQLQDQTAAQEKAAAEQGERSKREIDFQEKLGLITPKQAAGQQQNVVQNVADAQVIQLQAQQAQYHPEQGADQATKYQEIQNQITAIQQKASDQRAQIVQQETLRMVAAWEQAYQQMTGAVISATNSWLTTHKSFANSFIDAGKHLTVEFIDDLIKMGAKWAEHEAVKFAVHEGWIATTKTADATAAAASTATAAGENAAKIALNAALATSAAGVAAAQAAAEAAVGGPAAAIAAGAAMLAAMSPFVAAASAEYGGTIPGRQGQAVPIIGHGQELVIPAPLSSMLTSAANNGAGGGGGHTFHSTYAPQISVLDSKGINGFISRGSEMNFAAMRKQARRINATS